MKVFKMDLRILKARADGRPGFVNVKQGDTPEQHGFTPEEYDPDYAEGLFPLLMDGEGCVTETVTMTEDEVLDQCTLEQKIVFTIAAMLKEDPKQKDKKLWTKANEPRVEAIERLIDASITETQRDEAWANFKEGDNK